ncbi:MAG: hypothetical protein U5K74_07945 [Gemmatimonadaceae bacterium]|nr:hypothetical protein [Gemmatimonadaceae bacterium]
MHRARHADRADAPIHHVARRDDVGAGLGVHDRLARQQLQRGIVVHRLTGEHAAVPVVGVLAHAHIGDDEQLRKTPP